MNRFDRVFWRRLWRLARPYWVSEKKWVALSLLATTLMQVTGPIWTQLSLRHLARETNDS